MTKNIQTIAFADIRDVLSALNITSREDIENVMDDGFHSSYTLDATYALVDVNMAWQWLWEAIFYNKDLNITAEEYNSTYWSVVDDAKFINVIWA